MPPTSSLYRMADRLAGGKLTAILRDLRTRGLSPERIASRLYAEYGIEVTGATVANWLADLDGPSSPVEVAGPAA